jgi:hypothetical protein
MSQLLFPCEDETVENTIDFHSVSYHRIYIKAVVTSVKIATGKAVLKSVRNCGRFCGDHSLQTMDTFFLTNQIGGDEC